MTRERIQELRALAAAASPGPWSADKPVKGDTDLEAEAVVRGLYGYDPAMHGYDAAFIAAARNALPEALDALDRVLVIADAFDKSAVTCAGDGDLSQAMAWEQFGWELRRAVDGVKHDA